MSCLESYDINKVLMKVFEMGSSEITRWEDYNCEGGK